MITPVTSNEIESTTTVESAYADQSQYMTTIADAAEHLARSSRYCRERETLAVGGVVLLVFTILKGLALMIGNVSERFMPGSYLLWAWIVVGCWGGAYAYRISRLRHRIIENRLCLSCGRSLLSVPIGPTNIGFCPDCGTMFTPGEYAPPGRCISALRAARKRTETLFPPAAEPLTPLITPVWPYCPIELEPERHLYQDRRHFGRVINSATRRLIRRDARTPCVSVFAVLPWLVVVCVVGLTYIGEKFLLVLPAIFVVGVGAVMYEILRYSSARERIIGARRCLNCGHPLEQEPLTAGGGGLCPKCTRPFHIKEYVCPPDGWIQPDWREIREEVMPKLPHMGIDPIGRPPGDAPSCT